MKNIKRKTIALILCATILACTSMTAMAAEFQEEGKSTNVEVLPDYANGIVPYGGTTDLFMGTLSGSITRGSFTLNSDFIDTRVQFRATPDKQNSTATYKMVITGPSNKTIYLIADGKARSYNAGTMKKGKYTYTITRESGTGTYNYSFWIIDLA